MSRARPLVLGAAIVVVALLTSLLTYNWLKKKAAPGADKAVRQAVVSAVDIQRGTLIGPAMVKPANFFNYSLPSGVFASPAQVVGRVALVQLKANEQVLEADLAPTSVTMGGVAAIIGQDKRAMAVHVDKRIAVAGFIHPGDHVDVYVTFMENNNSVTKLVLEDIPVLATGEKVQKKNKNFISSNPITENVITLEVTPEDGEKLALAESQGKLLLALRNVMDDKTVLTPGATAKALLASYRGGGIAPAPKIFRAAARMRPKDRVRPAPGYAVQFINGSKIENLKFKEGNRK